MEPSSKRARVEDDSVNILPTPVACDALTSLLQLPLGVQSLLACKLDAGSLLALVETTRMFRETERNSKLRVNDRLAREWLVSKYGSEEEASRWRCATRARAC